MDENRLLRLGVQMAELEALYARVLEAADPHSEQHRLAALAEAATRFSETARTAAHHEQMPSRHPAARRPVRRTRLERRISHTRRTTEWIITRATQSPR
ncbi:hypothetical protein ACFOY4_42030 [Actinomadura syzygii]|uniref:Uncharacterized protein n=1 Tax=Actinomadura syzygii TaxID=1427538 RepID=A0A5D0TPR3_9ACTN|nr:hypothetical protein [Actinomadura syzygii]TYC07390.1 hypothetical protein FXF65_42780 [Actinomadura syzygii]